MENKLRYSRLMKYVVSMSESEELHTGHGTHEIERMLLSLVHAAKFDRAQPEDLLEIEQLRQTVEEYYGSQSRNVLKTLSAYQDGYKEFPGFNQFKQTLAQLDPKTIVTAPVAFRILQQMKGRKTRAIGSGQLSNGPALYAFFSSMAENLQRNLPVPSSFLRRFTDTLMRGFFASPCSEKPRCVMTLIGTGEMEKMLVEKASDYMGLKLLTITMSDYIEPHSICTLIGENPTYHCADSGLLTKFAESTPEGGVVLVTGLEKGSAEVQLLFESILESGKKLDRYTGKEVSFHNHIFVFTTAAGAESIVGEPTPLALAQCLTDEKQRGALKLSLAQRLLCHSVLLSPTSSAAELCAYCASQFKRIFWERFPTVDLEMDAALLARLILLNQSAECSSLTLSAGMRHLLEDCMMETMRHSNVKRVEVIIDTDDTSVLQLLHAQDADFSRKAAVFRYRRQRLTFQYQVASSHDGVCRIRFHTFCIEQAALGLRLGEASIPEVTMDDVIGQQEAKETLLEMLKNQKGGTVLFSGPPGTGKTLLAQALAASGEMPFYSITASSLLMNAQGEGEKQLRELFARARKEAPSLLFIDEIDFVFADRNQMGSAKPLLGELLVQLSGFGMDDSRVIVIMATNQASALDDALLSRFQRILHFRVPGNEERRAFLKRRCGTGLDASEQEIEHVLQYGCSLRELNHVVNLAQRKCEGAAVSGTALLEAVRTVCLGDAAPHAASPDTIRRIAFHEAAHAVIAHALGMNVQEVSIQKRGTAEGHCRLSNIESALTSHMLQALGVQALAGRAAEMILLGDDGENSGAASDLEKARKLAMQTVEFGFNGILLCKTEGDQAAEAADRVLASYMEEAMRLVKLHISDIHSLTNKLLKQQVLYGKNLQRTLNTKKYENR